MYFLTKTVERAGALSFPAYGKISVSGKMPLKPAEGAGTAEEEPTVARFRALMENAALFRADLRDIDVLMVKGPHPAVLAYKTVHGGAKNMIFDYELMDIVSKASESDASYASRAGWLIGHDVRGILPTCYGSGRGSKIEGVKPALYIGQTANIVIDVQRFLLLSHEDRKSLLKAMSGRNHITPGDQQFISLLEGAEKEMEKIKSLSMDAEGGKITAPFCKVKKYFNESFLKAGTLPFEILAEKNMKDTEEVDDHLASRAASFLMYAGIVDMLKDHFDISNMADEGTVDDVFGAYLEIIRGERRKHMDAFSAYLKEKYGLEPDKAFERRMIFSGEDLISAGKEVEARAEYIRSINRDPGKYANIILYGTDLEKRVKVLEEAGLEAAVSTDLLGCKAGDLEENLFLLKRHGYDLLQADLDMVNKLIAGDGPGFMRLYIKAKHGIDLSSDGERAVITKDSLGTARVYAEGNISFLREKGADLEKEEIRRFIRLDADIRERYDILTRYSFGEKEKMAFLDFRTEDLEYYMPLLINKQGYDVRRITPEVFSKFMTGGLFVDTRNAGAENFAGEAGRGLGFEAASLREKSSMEFLETMSQAETPAPQGTDIESREGQMKFFYGVMARGISSYSALMLNELDKLAVRSRKGSWLSGRIEKVKSFFSGIMRRGREKEPFEYGSLDIEGLFNSMPGQSIFSSAERQLFQAVIEEFGRNSFYAPLAGLMSGTGIADDGAACSLGEDIKGRMNALLVSGADKLKREAGIFLGRTPALDKKAGVSFYKDWILLAAGRIPGVAQKYEKLDEKERIVIDFSLTVMCKMLEDILIDVVLLRLRSALSGGQEETEAIESFLSSRRKELEEKERGIITAILKGWKTLDNLREDWDKKRVDSVSGGLSLIISKENRYLTKIEKQGIFDEDIAEEISLKLREVYISLDEINRSVQHGVNFDIVQGLFAALSLNDRIISVLENYYGQMYLEPIIRESGITRDDIAELMDFQEKMIKSAISNINKKIRSAGEEEISQDRARVLFESAALDMKGLNDFFFLSPDKADSASAKIEKYKAGFIFDAYKELQPEYDRVIEAKSIAADISARDFFMEAVETCEAIEKRKIESAETFEQLKKTTQAFRMERKTGEEEPGKPGKNKGLKFQSIPRKGVYWGTSLAASLVFAAAGSMSLAYGGTEARGVISVCAVLMGVAAVYMAESLDLRLGVSAFFKSGALREKKDVSPFREYEKITGFEESRVAYESLGRIFVDEGEMSSRPWAARAWYFAHES
ncbi:MAG: hypothetical protein ABH883_01010, partial [Candidatus Omnitrophota bacterium]